MLFTACPKQQSPRPPAASGCRLWARHARRVRRGCKVFDLNRAPGHGVNAAGRGVDSLGLGVRD